ncbi:hypothetical protein D3C72_1740850 [compost metagenome]
MAKAQKTLLSVVRAPAAVAHAAKRQVVVGDVHQRVVHRHAAAHGAAQHIVTHRLALTKPVQRQRARPGVDVRNGVIEPLVGDHGQDGAKNLFLHELHLRRGAKHQRGQHLAAGPIAQRAHGVDHRLARSRLDGLHLGTLRLRLLQHGAQAGVVAWRDDGGVVAIAFNGREESLHSGPVGLGELAFAAAG